MITKQYAEKSEGLLVVSPSPHERRRVTTASVMKDVFIALLPATIWGCYQFGWRAALIVLLAVVSSVLFEMLTQMLLHRPVAIADFSAALTGLLLGLNLSPAVPIYVAILGSAFAIVVVKQLFGGIGKNIMNPALAARVFLMLSWPETMTVFPKAYDRVGLGKAADAVASATPMMTLKNGTLPEDVGVFELFFGKIGGCIGDNCKAHNKYLLRV